MNFRTQDEVPPMTAHQTETEALLSQAKTRETLQMTNHKTENLSRITKNPGRMKRRNPRTPDPSQTLKGACPEVNHAGEKEESIQGIEVCHMKRGKSTKI